MANAVLAARIEASVVRDLRLYVDACLRLEPRLGAQILPVAGGIAIFLAPGSPINTIYGAGLSGAVSGREIDSAEEFYRASGTRAAISLCPLADESLIAQLSARGWMLTDFENVLVRDVGGESSLPAPASGVSVSRATSMQERATWSAISAGAFSWPEPPSAEITRLGDAMASRDDSVLLTGRVDGNDAGAAALWLDDGLGWLLADATLPEWRRRGVQSALHAERIRLARDAGCELAVTEARPGSTSQRNMERMGFRVVYTRVEMIAPPHPTISEE